jgi:NAD(P)-dependent dehydrogenase (short-subunit alcohol dehydrogenase family)
MLSQVGRLEMAGAGVTVSVVYPSVTATEFHQRLRAGTFRGGAPSIPADPPELVGEAVAFAIRTGEAHVLVADPPRSILPGDSEGWGALLARHALGAAAPRSSREEDSQSSGLVTADAAEEQPR